MLYQKCKRNMQLPILFYSSYLGAMQLRFSRAGGLLILESGSLWECAFL